jgi:hypothetical protein
MHAHPRMFRRINTFRLPQSQPQVTLSNLTHYKTHTYDPQILRCLSPTPNDNRSS